MEKYEKLKEERDHLKLFPVIIKLFIWYLG